MEICTGGKAKDWFLAPLAAVFGALVHERKCPGISDLKFIECGIMRVLMEGTSGRDFVQKIRMAYLALRLSGSLLSKSLGSSRRRNLTDEAAEALRQRIDRQILVVAGADPLAAHPELARYAIYATDGHTHAASAHEPFRFGKKYPVSPIIA
jgi:hypothetical protein